MTVKFAFVPNRIVTWPVIVRQPQDGGTIVEASFSARLRMIDADEHDKIRALLKDSPDTFSARLMAAVFDGFADVDGLEDDGPAARAALLSAPGVQAGIASAFYDAYLGRAREGN